MPLVSHITQEKALHYLTFRIVRGLGLFTYRIHRDIILDGFRDHHANAGLLIHGWVIMSDHVHVLLSTPDGTLSNVVRSFKEHSSKAIITAIQEENDVRCAWILSLLAADAKPIKDQEYAIWEPEDHPAVVLPFALEERLAYIHENPVRAGWVDKPRDYVYSSARDYADEPGLVKIARLV